MLQNLPQAEATCRRKLWKPGRQILVKTEAPFLDEAQSRHGHDRLGDAVEQEVPTARHCHIAGGDRRRPDLCPAEHAHVGKAARRVERGAYAIDDGLVDHWASGLPEPLRWDAERPVEARG